MKRKCHVGEPTRNASSVCLLQTKKCNCWIFMLVGKLVSLVFVFLFSLTLDRPREVEWFKFQFFQKLLLWIMGQVCHTRGRMPPLAKPCLASCADFFFLFLFYLFSIEIFDFFDCSSWSCSKLIGSTRSRDCCSNNSELLQQLERSHDYCRGC